MVLRTSEMEGVRPSRVADVPVISEGRDRTLILVESGKTLEDFAADRERRRIVDQGRIEGLRVFGFDQLQVAGSTYGTGRAR